MISVKIMRHTHYAWPSYATVHCTVEIWFVFEYDIMTWLLVTGLPSGGGVMVVLVEGSGDSNHL